ncbi:MAG: pyruvate kinase [Thermodesulfobacteriota bacterium]
MPIDTNIELLINCRTKIVATLGPSSNDIGTIEGLIDAGADVFRLNMSHGTLEDHAAVYRHIRSAAQKLQKPVAVLADLCGPKIRVGAFKGGRVELAKGSIVTVTCRDVEGFAGLIPSQYRALCSDVKADDRILLDDGNFELQVESVDGTEIACRVVTGGLLRDHKGMNLPGVHVSTPSLTEKDRKDALFAVKLGVDFLALSFVRRGSDVEGLRALISRAGAHVAIIAKIEKPEALDHIAEIIAAADGIMVARGDLGVELPPQSVPNAQDQLIDLARRNRKPVIVATQMLESMIEHPRPTRAEVSDVATAVRSGADAVMLSAESASGKYPVEAVKMMDGIARQTEAYLWRRGAFGSLARHYDIPRPLPVEDALSESMSGLSRDLLVRAIVAISLNDHALAVMSSSRPAAPIVGICPDYRASCIANLLWGVIPVTVDLAGIDSPVELARRTVLTHGLADKGQSILLVRGFHSDPRLNTPSVTAITV